MEPDAFERLLKGYQLPEVSPEFDRRVLRRGAGILARAPARATLNEVGRTVLHQLGFGYVPWLVDVVTTADAEYRVDVL